jgi:hypothetical protein
MAVSSLVAAGGGKTMFRTTLTSGTSYTVPAGVNYLNVTLYGAGGGGGGGGNTAGAGGAGGNTTFTGATTAVGGFGGAPMSRDANVNGVAANANSGNGGRGFTSGDGGTSTGWASSGGQGDIFASFVTTTPGASIAYSIGAGGTAGTGGTAGAGGSGRIEIEYWV